MGWFSDILPDLIKVGGNVIGGVIQGGAQKDAAQEQQKLSKEAAALIKAGLDQQAEALLSGNAEVRALIENHYFDATGNLKSDFAPYQAVGPEALGYFQNVVAQDPTQLTLSQRRGFDRAHRQSLSNLAASGLRGAGRSGVAAVNEGDAAYMAAAEMENRRRSDDAARSLLQSGQFGATGTTATRDASLRDLTTVIGDASAIKGGTALNKAEADAGAYTTGGEAINQARLANRLMIAQGIGSLAGVFANPDAYRKYAA